MQVTWNGNELELAVDRDPVHAAIASLVAAHAEIGEFREYLDHTTSTRSNVDRAKMYADGKQDGLSLAINSLVGAVRLVH